MIRLLAIPQPGIEEAFIFGNLEEFTKQAKEIRDKAKPQKVTFSFAIEYAVPLLEELFHAAHLDEKKIPAFFRFVTEFTSDEIFRAVVAIRYCGKTFTATSRPENFRVELYPASQRELVLRQYVAQRRREPIPETLRRYINYDSLAHDLGARFQKITVAGSEWIYQCPGRESKSPTPY